MSNPGPASTTTANYVMVPQNELRLLGVLKNLNLAAAADTAFPCITASGLLLPLYVVTANSSGTTLDIHSATVGVYTAPSQGGSTVLTTAALTSQTTAAYVKVQSPTNAATGLTGVTTFFANVGTTVAGGQCDLYVYGFELG
jgi:hypothetical protein